MAAISGSAPQPSDNSLITSEQEHLKLIAQQVSTQAIPIFQIAHLVALYAHHLPWTCWHTALKLLNILPEQIPPLPLNTDQIREGMCPIGGSFYLLPRGTLNQFEELVNAYGQEHFGKEQPRQFQYCWALARQDHGFTQFEKEEWRWMSDDLLQGSLGQSYEEQSAMVAKLGANFEIPSLRDAAMCLLLHKIGTGESLLSLGNDQNKNLSIFARVQKTAHSSGLVIGVCAPSCVVISSLYDRENVGIMALHKF